MNEITARQQRSREAYGRTVTVKVHAHRTGVNIRTGTVNTELTFDNARTLAEQLLTASEQENS